MLFTFVDESFRFLASIDRANIGNARIDGLAKDLKLNGDKFNIALLVFYIPYILVDIPSNWIIKYFQAGYYLPFLLISWVGHSLLDFPALLLAKLVFRG
jgi:hypothetical protein